MLRWPVWSGQQIESGRGEESTAHKLLFNLLFIVMECDCSNHTGNTDVMRFSVVAFHVVYFYFCSLSLCRRLTGTCRVTGVF